MGKRLNSGFGACMRGAFLVGVVLLALGTVAADLSSVLAMKAPPAPVPAAYDWSGFYLGGHLGYAWGNSNWTTPGVSGSLDLFQPFDVFAETGSYFGGLQVGYDTMLANRFVIGVETDASFPSFPNLTGISIGGTSTFSSLTIGPESYSETMLSFGAVRGRIGYAPGNWLFYATGGVTWTYDRLTLTQLASGTTESPFLWRLGWVAGIGVEVSVAPHWTANLEYLFTDYSNSSVAFPAAMQRFDSSFSLQELRAGWIGAELDQGFGFANTHGIAGFSSGEQQVTDNVGVFARAGWADGNVEPWDFTDIDRTVSAGVSLNGKSWGRPDDTIGIAGVVNDISGIHQALLNAGGLGILVGDGMLPHPATEQIIETYYSYALTASTRLTADYQFINNPGYNTDRGPANVFSGRVHWQF